MKRHIIILGVIMSTSVNGQIIDWSQFDEDKMNEVMFAQMSNYTSKNWSYPLVQTKIGKDRIYRYIKNNCDKMSLDDLNEEINTKILWKLDSRASSQTNQLGNVGLIASVQCQDFKTFQEITNKCITDWANSENLIFLRWSQAGEAISFYNRRTQVVYVFWAYLN
jgi:hypothetical protein